MKLCTKIIHFVSALLFCIPAWSGSPRFQTESSALSIEKLKLYSDVENTLNDWTGESEKLIAAGVMIDNFIQINPDFLPIYVEKARMEIMFGSIGTNDPMKANLNALRILADIQEKDPNYSKSYVLAGHAFLNIEDFEGAKKSLEHAERIGKTDPWLYNNWADYYGRKMQYDQALASARNALVLANDNGKALVTAIYFISKYSKFTAQPSSDADISQFVFESFKDPEQRLRIATRLINAYRGDSNILDRAYEIIERQAKDTPRLESLHLAMAEWFLKKGFMRNENNIVKYDRRFSSAAEEILGAISPSKSVEGKVFPLRFSIALSNDDIAKAGALLKDAETAGFSRSDVLPSKALMMWYKEDYATVVAILESLAKDDPSFADNSLLMTAYSRLGRRDMLIAHYKRQIERDPTNAWALGNFAGFLLFTMHDVDEAIRYGDKALSQMKYPIAENTTALAYLMKASILRRAGDIALSEDHVKRAISIGYSDSYVFEYCASYCADIQEMLKRQ